jgi:hypothetical protein
MVCQECVTYFSALLDSMKAFPPRSRDEIAEISTLFRDHANCFCEALITLVAPDEALRKTISGVGLDVTLGNIKDYLPEGTLEAVSAVMEARTSVQKALIVYSRSAAFPPWRLTRSPMNGPHLGRGRRP